MEEITESNLTFSENPLERLEDIERKDFIKKCIAQLSESEAAIVTLFYFEELSIKEIGKVTGLTEDNVKVKLHRSRKKLYDLLQPRPVVNEKE